MTALPWKTAPDRPMVVAFGGNALIPDPGDPGGAERRANEFAAALVHLIPEQAGVVLVHGNGPQVGTLLLRVEGTRDDIPPDPLDVLVAQTQGSIGYLLQRALRNSPAGRDLEVVTMVTQVVVDGDDPAMLDPTKPVGPFYPPEEGRALAAANGWKMVEVPNRGVRRVVPSPVPREVVEIDSIADGAGHGEVVIAGGGGGIPVRRGDDGRLIGVEAVIDKDRTGALIATTMGSGGFVILTEVGHASTSFGSDDEAWIPEMDAARADELLAAGEFPPGSMGPKVESAAAYARATGVPALITSVDALPAALRGEDGTWVTP